MAFVPAHWVAKADMIMGAGGVVLVNSVYARGIEEWTVLGLEQLASVLDVWWDGYYAPYTSTGNELVNIRVRDLTGEWSNIIEYPPQVSGGGDQASEILPYSVSATLKFKTGIAGKGYRGRIYWAALTAGQVAVNAIEPVTTAGMIAAGEALADALDGIDKEHVVLHQYYLGAPLTQAVVTQVKYYTSDGLVKSQRRRLV
jgi:hypothetical protein